MDPIGVTSIALQLFSGCLVSFSFMVSAKNFGPDAATLRCMLRLDEYRLRMWAQNAGLLDDDLDQRLNKSLVEETLSQIRTLLSDTATLKRRYNLNYMPSENESLETKVPEKLQLVDSFIPTNLDFLNHTQVVRTQTRVLDARKLSGPGGFVKKMRWAALDKESFVNLVKDIGVLIDKLQGLLDSVNQRAMANDIRLLHCEMARIAQEIPALQALQGAASALYGNGSVTESIVTGRKTVLQAGTAGTQMLVSPPPLELQLEASQIQNVHIYREQGNGKYGLAHLNGSNIYVEHKEYVVESVGANWLSSRVKSLSCFLGACNPEHFRSLQCIAYYQDIQRSRYCFLYKIPGAQTPSISSLLEIVQNKSLIPSLSARFRLATDLANTVLYLHSAGWLHKNLRSENVLFLCRKDVINLSSPYVMGYELARINNATEFSEKASRNAEADLYRHPQTLDSSRRKRFCSTFDIYSLGMILLELAYWYPLSRIFRDYIDLRNCSEYHLKRLQDIALSDGSGILDQVRFRMGDVYCEVVTACISGTFDSTSEQSDESRELAGFFHSVVQKLESCNV